MSVKGKSGPRRPRPVYVVSNDGYCDYGMAVAEDTGVRGNTIDLYMDSYNECIQFGVREVPFSIISSTVSLSTCYHRSIPSIMSKKNRRAAALIRQLAAAAVIPLTVLTMALAVRPVERNAAALYI